MVISLANSLILLKCGGMLPDVSDLRQKSTVRVASADPFEPAEEARCCLCVLALRPFHMCSASSAPAWACAPLRLCPLNGRVCGSSSHPLPWNH
jgi:hypothetical protein